MLNKNIRNTFGLVSLISALAFSGCENGDNEPSADPNAPFAITYPSTNNPVNFSEVIEGTGLKEGYAEVRVRVKTNHWWDQPGTVERKEDNSWTYNRACFGGDGVYNNHTLEVTTVYSNGVTETATVDGLVRQD